MVYILPKKKKTYNIVVSKSGNQIAFKNINSQDSALKVIKFEDVANGMDYYDNIKTGDTLKIFGIKESGTYKNYYGSEVLGFNSRIININGVSLSAIKKSQKPLNSHIETIDCNSFMNEIHKLNQNIR